MGLSPTDLGWWRVRAALPSRGPLNMGNTHQRVCIVIVALGAVLADAKPFPVNALPKTASPKLRAAPGGWLEPSLCPHLINEGGRPKVT